MNLQRNKNNVKFLVSVIVFKISIFTFFKLNQQTHNSNNVNLNAKIELLESEINKINKRTFILEEKVEVIENKTEILKVNPETDINQFWQKPVIFKTRIFRLLKFKDHLFMNLNSCKKKSQSLSSAHNLSKKRIQSLR